jgi:hypothetical protein
MQQFLSTDVEFYHDKGGIINGLADVSTTTKNNLCSNKNFRLRREEIKNSIKVFPMSKSDTLYGAILSGDHLFYVTENGKPEQLSGMARFTHLWLVNNGTWKMTRILSYDHGPPPYINTRKEIQLSAQLLNRYAKKYIGKMGIISIKREGHLLTLITGDKKFILYPETETVFFIKDRDLTFEFVWDEKKKVTALIVREGGQIVDKATPTLN